MLILQPQAIEKNSIQKVGVCLLPLAGEGGPTKSGRMRDAGGSGYVSLFRDLPHPTPLRGATFSRRRKKEDPASIAEADKFDSACAADVSALATRALLAELETYPKPGLVSLVDSGSHDDMDAAVFRRSAAALAPFFAQLAAAGAEGADLPHLRAIGLDAEAAMLAATNGVNTHRGAIFALGLLCAAAGTGARDPAAHVRDAWGATLAGERPAGSHGADAMTRHGVGGARGEAAAGFPTVVRRGLPALREGRRVAISPERPIPVGAREESARVQAFFALLAACDDTNLLHRGGTQGLVFARREATAFLESGGVARPTWFERATAIHHAFVERRLSPGGSADLLAVTLFLDAVERIA